MNKLSVWAMNTPIREWVIGGVTRKHYQRFFNTLKNKTVLEIGCGNGSGAKTILKYFNPGKITAIDLDPRLVKAAKMNVQNPRITFSLADATNLPFRDKSFEAVFEYVTIHHIPSPHWQKSLREIYRVLKPGGKVFIYDASIESFNTLWGRILKIITVHPYEKMYTKMEFINYLKKSGFKTLYEEKDSRHFIIVAEK